jgi:hypothetical protein
MCGFEKQLRAFHVCSMDLPACLAFTSVPFLGLASPLFAAFFCPDLNFNCPYLDRDFFSVRGVCFFYYVCAGLRAVESFSRVLHGPRRASRSRRCLFGFSTPLFAAYFVRILI